MLLQALRMLASHIRSVHDLPHGRSVGVLDALPTMSEVPISLLVTLPISSTNWRIFHEEPASPRQAS